jgi:hypothetical protein
MKELKFTLIIILIILTILWIIKWKIKDNFDLNSKSLNNAISWFLVLLLILIN